MAIHIWDDAEQTYRSVDLAQYGSDGTLTGAYMWRDGEWRTLWEKSSGVPEPLWVDDFTAPTLHERWMLLDGEYTPPGLTYATILGPQSDSECEITFTVSELTATSVAAVLFLDSDFNMAAMAMQTGDGVQLVDGVQRLSPGHTGGDRITLRRVGGQFTVLVNGEPATGPDGALVAPDPGGTLTLAAEAQDGATVTLIEYTVL